MQNWLPGLSGGGKPMPSAKTQKKSVRPSFHSSALRNVQVLKSSRHDNHEDNMKFPSSLQRVRALTAPLIAATVIVLAGCSGEYGYSRSVFQGKVVDRPAAEIESFAGKPDAVDKLTSGDEVWTYSKRTFDAENGNAKDAAVKITLRKDLKSGALAYADIDFVAQ